MKITSEDHGRSRQVASTSGALLLVLAQTALAQTRNAPPPEGLEGFEVIVRIVVIAFLVVMAIVYTVRRRAAIKAPPPIEPDEEVLGGLFAKDKTRFFASEQDLEGKLILTNKCLRYVGLSTQKVLLSLNPSDIVSLDFKGPKIRLTFLDAKGRKRKRKYKLLQKLADSAGFTTLPGAKTYESATPIPDFQEAIKGWHSKNS